jgi:hypothetical protein
MPAPENLTFPTFLALSGTQLEVLVFDFNTPKVPLFLLRFPESTSFGELKVTIAREAEREYVPSRDTMEFFKADPHDVTVPCLSPLRLR